MFLKKIIQSFKYAFRGCALVVKGEKNFRIQLLIAVIILILSFYFSLSKNERIIIIILNCIVLSMEMINTAVEHFLDLVKPRLHYRVSVVKDIMAGAVFLVSFCAVIIGVYIFLPYLVTWGE